MRPSLQRRLLWLILGATIVVWVVTIVSTWLDARHEIDELLDAHLAQAAALLIVRSTGEIEEVDIEHAPILHPDARKVAFQVWEEGRSLRLHSLNAPSQPLGTAAEGFSDRVIEGQAWRVFSAWDASREMLIHVGERADVRAELADELAEGLLRPLLLALPALAVLLWLAIRGGLRPLLALRTELARRDPENLAAIDDAHAPREVVPLIDQLNRLFERIRHSLERERRFTADAAHELRTPIAAIKAQAQVAQLAGSDAVRAHALEQVVTGADRAARLVDQLLTLARLDAVDLRTLAPHPLRRLVAEVLAERAPALLAQGMSVELSDGPELHVRCEPALITALLRNLLDNAGLHARAGTVHVSVQQADGRAVLAITDAGPGIPVEARQKVLQRFHRLESAGAGGSGLGLSIVQRIAALHGATLELKPGAGGTGLRVEVAFSLVPEEPAAS
jgi:two-component system sensor histidine kinase QseC